MLDVVDRGVAFTLHQSAVDGEELTARGMEDEVSRAGDGSARPKRLIEERRGRERVVRRQTQLRGAGERTDVYDAEVLGGAQLRDRLGRIEQLGELFEVRHGDVHGCFGPTAHASPRNEDHGNRRNGGIKGSVAWVARGLGG